MFDHVAGEDWISEHLDYVVEEDVSAGKIFKISRESESGAGETDVISWDCND